MREIKFRAWDGVEMYGPLIIHSKIYRSQEAYEAGDYAPYDNVMQYTGLNDRNGKEIYEGDILKYTYGGKTKIDVIEFKPPLFTYRNCIRWSLGEDEVIGNIYENPDLIEHE